MTSTIQAAALFLCMAMPLAAQVTGKFRVEKERYLLGEPVFVTFTFENRGSSDILHFDSHPECLGFFAEQIRPPLKKCPGGYGGSCSPRIQSLAPGKSYSRRWLLNGSRETNLDRSGSYLFSLAIPFQWSEGDADALRTTQATKFEDLVALEIEELSDPEALLPHIEPVITGADSPNSAIAFEAIRTMNETAPPILEDKILAISRRSGFEYQAAKGLFRLNTVATRKRLAEMTQSSSSHLQTAAINYLGKMGDTSYVTLLKRIAKREGENPRLQGAALEAVGSLVKEDAIPFISTFAASENAVSRRIAIQAFIHTASRKAIPHLLQMWRVSADRNTAESIRGALSTLTHRSGPSDLDDWERWWDANSATAEIHDVNECGIQIP